MHYIVLRPALATALARARARRDSPLASAPIASLHRQFSDLGELERHVIDTTAQSPEQTQAAIRAAAESGRFRLG